MRLTAEQHPEAIKRYGHLKPSRGLGAKSCSVGFAGTAHKCTRAEGHRGPHVAHRLFGKVVAVWEGDAAEVPSVPSPQSTRRKAPAAHRPTAKRPIGLRSRSPVGIVEGLVSFIARVGSSLEEIAWITFFLAFVGFAIGGILLIYLG